MNIPDTYAGGYEKARAIDPERAANYVAHTTVGDPLADALIDELAAIGHNETNRLIQLAIQGDRETLRNGPASLRALFESSADRPAWVDLQSHLPGCRMFHRNAPIVLAGMVAGTLVEGFSTNIAKSFFLSGRLRDQGMRRLKQNNRHMLEIFMPGGMDRYGDGWAYSVRIRIIHARIRHLLATSGEWDAEELGLPLSSAHIGLAITVFSARLLHHIMRLGASFNDEERQSFMAVWRYSGWLMGIPESMLFRDEADALEIFKIGLLCEPPVSLESIVMASALINSAPLFIGHTERDQRVKTAQYAFRICRALIGNQLADELKLPRSGVMSGGVLWKFRMLNKVENLMKRVNSRLARERSHILNLLDVSMYEDTGISYRLPDHHFSERSSEY